MYMMTLTMARKCLSKVMEILESSSISIMTKLVLMNNYHILIGTFSNLSY